MPRKPLDLLNKRVGRLLIVEKIGNLTKKDGSKGPILWKCHCDCGNICQYRAADLNKGVVVSCGCYNREKSTKHGMHKSRTYKIWHNMKTRCQNPNDTSYAYYGGRGIRCCKRWQKFENFLSDMGECPSDQHTIDRINTNSDYKPSNCRWATRSEQQNNKRVYTNWNQKINEEDVKIIRASKLDPMSLAVQYGVTYTHMCAIKNGSARKKVK